MNLSLESSLKFANLLRFASDIHEHDTRIRWANSNGVPLCFMDDRAFDASSSFSDWKLTKELALRELPREKLTWFSEYSAVVEALDRKGIEIRLIKTNGPFPFWSGNIDSIIDEKDLGEAARTLESMGFVRISCCDEPHKLLFKRFSDGRTVISLHLHSRIVWDATYVLCEDAIAANRQIDSESKDSESKIRTINGGPLIATILAHAFLENQSVRLIDLFIVEDVMKGDNEALDDAVRIAEKMGWSREFFLASQAFLEADKILIKEKGGGLLDNFARMIPTHDADVFAKTLTKRIEEMNSFPIDLPTLPTKGFLMKRIYVRNDMPGFPSGTSRIGFFIKNYFIRKLGNSRVKGRIIAISGPDGSGKTTIAKGVAELMRDMGIDFDIYWSRYGSVPKLVRKAEVGERKRVRPVGVTNKSRMKLIENIIKLKVKSISTRMSGRNVIFDRHFIDTMVDFQMETGEEFHPFAKIGESSIIEPDLHIILMANPETLAARSGEGVNSSSIKARIYSKIIEENKGTKMIGIDASRKESDIIDELTPILSMTFFYEMV